MRKSTKIFIGIFAGILLLAVYSLIPVVGLYCQKDPPIVTNADAIEKIKNNKGGYFQFIVFGDNHAGLILDDSAALKEIRSMNREGRFRKVPIDFVMSSGDITFRGSPLDYRIFNRLRSRITMPVICAAGNHDDDTKTALADFKKYCGPAEFSFANRNSFFIVLDNSRGNLTEAQFARFEEALKQSQAYQHRFVILHKPAMSFYQQSWYRPETNPWSYRFMKLCEAAKVDIVFSGHEHMSMTATHGGVTYVVTGGGGIITQLPAREGGFLHYVVVRVYGDYVDYEVRRILPPFWEYLVYYIWKEGFYFLKAQFS